MQLVKPYTFDFNVYIGKTFEAIKTLEMPESSFKSNKTLKSVIRDLTKPLINQGYHTYFDNSYISVKRVSDPYYSDTPLL